MRNRDLALNVVRIRMVGKVHRLRGGGQPPTHGLRAGGGVTRSLAATAWEGRGSATHRTSLIPGSPWYRSTSSARLETFQWHGRGGPFAE